MKDRDDEYKQLQAKVKQLEAKTSTDEMDKKCEDLNKRCKKAEAKAKESESKLLEKAKTDQEREARLKLLEASTERACSKEEENAKMLLEKT